MLAAALNDSSREALSVTAAVLVAVALGFIFQGRIVDEQVHAPYALRARLVAVEILAAGIFFVAAAVGVFSCLYYLAIDRIPIGADRKIIEHALLTSAVIGFLVTIAGRALPACWPPPKAELQPEALAVARWGIGVSAGLCVSAVPASLLMDTGTLLVFIFVLALVVFVSMMAMPAIERHLDREAIRARWLGRAAWTRVPVRPVRGGSLEGAGQLPPAFVLVSQGVGDPRLWMSRRGLRRLSTLLDVHEEDLTKRPDLRWQKDRVEVIYRNMGSETGRYEQDIIILLRNDARLYPVEPWLGLIVRPEPVGHTTSESP